MKTYGYARVSSIGAEDSLERQAEAIKSECDRRGLESLVILSEPAGTSGVSTRFRTREAGRMLLYKVKTGDTVLVTCIDRLGRKTVDILDTIERLSKKGVNVVILQFMGMTLDLSTPMGRVIIAIIAAFAEIEANFIMERFNSGKARLRATGFWAERTSYGKRRIYDDKGHYTGWEWDLEQLAYIAEIAERLGKGHDVKNIAADFRRRGIKDHRGLPWGLQQGKNGPPKGSPWQHFRQAARWFFRQRAAGKLPPPYNGLANLIQAPANFTVEKRPKKKTAKATINPRINWSLEDWQALDAAGLVD
jgi:DNA invertase Pin-like site-specific DNA recombinase